MGRNNGAGWVINYERWAAQRAGRRAEWTGDQLKAFNTLATSGDYNFVLQTCMRYFDVS